ncbi:MAG: ParB/Srx family N-terminal domain-containing protein [Thermoproteota archaeon]
MAKIFKMRLEDIQPSQLYISFKKLCEVMKRFNPSDPGSMEPIPVKKLGDDVIFVDGHTRAFAAFLCGISEVLVYWEDEQLDWEAYEICVEWCKESGIRSISDLKNRVVSQKDYEILWHKRCEDM